MCVSKYKIKENKGICFINLLQEHSTSRNNHGNQYKCSLWCFETHIHSHIKVESLLVELKEEQDGYKLKFKELGSFITKNEYFRWEIQKSVDSQNPK